MVDYTTEKLVAHEVANIFPMMGDEDYNALVLDIKKNGLMENIWLYEGKIIDGRNRYKACLEAGIKPMFREYEGKGSLVSFVLSLNLKRRHLDAGQKALVALKLLPFLSAEAKERLGHNQYTSSTQLFEESKTSEAAEQAGKLVGVNRQYIHEAKKMSDEESKNILSGKQKFAKVVKEHKMADRKEKIAVQVEEIKKLIPPTGEKKYGVIVIDPPWKNILEYDPNGARGAADYPQMENEEIAKIKIPSEDNCVLFLWTIDYYLHDALHIIDRWGFDRKTTLIWVKDKFGLGRFLRNQHEYCFVCIKGKPMFSGESTSTILNAPRGKHSEKPNEFYTLVEKICPDPRRLDYFARKKRNGWDVYGDEVKQ